MSARPRVGSGQRVTRLASGLTIATAEMPQMASVSVGLWIGVGSRWESEAHSGASHFIEHMLFKGTRRRSPKELSQAVEGLGGYMNAFTSEEMTCFHAKACHEHLDTLLDVLADMFLHSRFDTSDVDKEREVIKEEMAMYMDEAQHRVQELLNVTLWPDQPLGRPITGSNRSLDGIDRNVLIDFLRDHYVAGVSVVVAAGRIRHNELVKAVSRFERFFSQATPRAFIPARNHQTGPVVRLSAKKSEQAQVALGFRGFSRHDPRRHAVRLLSTVLGENMSSRLFQAVREDRGLAYSIYTSPSFFADTGDFVISAGLDTDKLGETLRLVARELKRIKQKPPSEAELRRAIDYVIGQISLNLEGTENQMNWLGEQLLGYRKIYSPESVKRRLSQVTARDIQAAAQDLFQPAHANLALVSPLKSAKHLYRYLRL